MTLWNWIPAGAFQLDVGLLVDPLSMTFVMLITFVGSLIHVYSIGYMEHDPEKRRFFAYLNLFVASMLLLVLADSYLLLFVGWEGVGLASYLLIGFWNCNPAYASAANKAFFVNRVGDLGLSIAIMLMFVTFGGVDYATVLRGRGDRQPGCAHGDRPAAARRRLRQVGAVPAAVAGSVTRWPARHRCPRSSTRRRWSPPASTSSCAPARSTTAAPDARLAVALVGAITLIFGAIVGCAKDDIKKALAASTMSQIGYMMLAAGLGPVGYAFAIFHLLTHGFFKAGMFLGAGLGHARHERPRSTCAATAGCPLAMKITWVTFGIGWLAILGVPPFSGFWSKDAIIEAAFIGEGWQPWVLGSAAIIGAGITAFYMSRLFFMTFHGEKRWDGGPAPARVAARHDDPDDRARLRVGLPRPRARPDRASSPAGSTRSSAGTARSTRSCPVWLIMAVTLGFVAVGALLAWTRYGRDLVPEVGPTGAVLTRAARQDLYQDAVNEGLFMRPGIHLTRGLVFADARGIDGAAGGLAALVGGLSSRLRRLQTGYVRSYALTMLTGVVAVLGALWVIQ